MVKVRVMCSGVGTPFQNSAEKSRPKKFAPKKIARQKLILHRRNKSKSARELMDFSATVVGVFCHKDKGVFFHIGDGAGLAFSKDQSENFIISEPANGAFSCETFFYTMDEWLDCLRFTFIENANRIILMTDGVTDFVFADDFYQIRQKFLLV